MSVKDAWQALAWLGRWPERRLAKQLAQNEIWCKEAQEALPLSAYLEWRSGNSDATD